MTELEDQRTKAILRDRRRASRIRTGEQDAIDAPIGLVAQLLAAAPHLRTQAETDLGPRTVEALNEYAPAS